MTSDEQTKKPCVCRKDNCDISYGQCHCGCGGPAPLATQKRSGQGLEKGDPQRYIRGHYPACGKPKPGGFPEGVLVDSEDEHLAQHKWCLTVNGRRRRKDVVRGSYHADGRYKQIRLHREIMQPPRGYDVDHINHNTLDNRRCNLRVVTRGVNMQNRNGLDWNNTSGYRGVSYDKQAHRWEAYGHVNDKKVFLGYYDDKDVAGKIAADWRLQNQPGYTG